MPHGMCGVCRAETPIGEGSKAISKQYRSNIEVAFRTSPVQPARSRVGQSVGTSIVLEDEVYLTGGEKKNNQ